MHVTAYGTSLPKRLCPVPALRPVAWLLLGCLFMIPQILTAQKITLALRNVRVEKVFEQIEAQTGYKFFYTHEDVAPLQTVNIDAKQKDISSILDACFKNTSLSYHVDGNYITIKTTGKKAIPDPKDTIGLIEINGRVLSEKGEPIAGATIQIKGSQTFVNTDNTGNFRMEQLAKGSTLIISSVGYQPQEIKIDKPGFSHVFLKIAVAALDETIVIAYGTTTRKLNTGAVGRLTASDIGKQPVSNPLAALQGNITGLQITQSNGLPGSNFNVLIRGTNSIQSGTDPLYIIDGVPFLNNTSGFTQRSGLVANSPFNNIDPSTIESIEVLKDADATAIYGSRGANGVILITTKRAKQDGIQTDFSFTQSLSRVRNAMPIMNSATYLQMRREAFANDAVTPDASNAPDLTVWDTSRYINWKHRLIGGNAWSSNAQLQIAGGSANTKFGVGLGYLKDGTVFPDNFFDRRINGTMYVSHQSMNKKFNLQVTSSYTDEQTHLPQQDLTSFIFLPPNMYEPYDSSGNLQWQEKTGTVSVGNPLATLQQPYSTLTDRFTSSGLVSFKVLPTLTFKALLGYNQIAFQEAAYYPIASQNPDYAPQGSVSLASSTEKTWNVEPQLEYSNDHIGHKGRLTALLGTTFQQSKDNNEATDGAGYQSDLLLHSIGAAPFVTTTNASNEYRYNALFARLNYNLNSRYIVNLTGRRDGSSRFGPGKQFANFGAVGAAWIFSEEALIHDRAPFLSFGKLRGSYGITGNDKIGNYQYLDSYLITTYPYQGAPALRPARLYNPDFSWENNIKAELAMELGFCKNRILFNAAWFSNKSTNQIIGFNLPGQTGASSVLMNFPGVVSNKGWELELQTVNIRHASFEWRTFFNVSITKNKLEKFPGLENSSYANTYMIGQPLNIRIGYQFLGVNPQTGVYGYSDLNKDGILNSLDYGLIGTTDPTFYGGLANTFKYKKWQLDVRLQFVKQKGIDPVYNFYTLPGTMTNLPELLERRWQKVGDRVPYQQVTQNYASNAGQAIAYLTNSSAILTDASFVRVKNIALLYSLGSSAARHVKLSNAQVFVQAQNLFTVTKYKGLDPESQSTGSLPPLLTLAAGIKITF
ncbi:SusC/RagA family TonB-linked outer membrane protein [Pinibacter aurantiacus]|uniref:SusC/RagA family TonB-linked outer membrane protein n=1 Tax=Pinibacter aurantiacus TaxID=2851599 RepID=A0A9E2W5V7_9BACT|nr:SusC/RagA family TonB-linked outer membrane protein [Pinibacter aurantiacus]MBV4359088.1 SusC/RagA family TonB-linked outer membrane protein [Pinibacter aurantiacus]